MTSNLAGKVALVTGGSRGIGYAIAEALLEQGVKVAICGRSQESLDKAVQALTSKGEIAGTTCNMGRNEDVEGLFGFVAKRFGGLDILVNNAGLGHFAPVHQLTLEQWREVIDTNLSGVFYATRAAVPMMQKRGGGFILNIGSLAGKNPFAAGAAYNASKFGLNGMTEAMMMDLRYENIRVSQIMPGSVETEFRPGGSDNADWKLSARQIAETAVHLLAMPERNLASRVEMRPSRPPRK
jgi:NAD(P)-dependent dehydrogenase (short-subunit alcohol dehydrogenase family)